MRRVPADLRQTIMFAGLLCTALLTTPITIAAQCALNVKPTPGETGYRKRSYGCEGLYVQLQSGSIAIQVVSLVRNALRLPVTDGAHVSAAAALAPGATLEIFGRGRRAGSNWALDGRIPARDAMIWDLRQVVRPLGFTALDLGLFGQVRAANDLQGPVYVPLDVRADSVVTFANGASSIELVVRIPGAGRAQWRFADTERYSDPIRPDGDGFFVMNIEGWRAGIHAIDISWSPRGRIAAFSTPEQIRIHFP